MANNHSVLSSTGDIIEVAGLSSRIKNTSVSVIKEMMYLGAQEIAKGKDVISLGVGIPYYKAPKHVHEHIVRQLAEKPDIDKYTLLTGMPKLREVIADVCTKAIGLKTTADQIIVTPGSMGALMYAVLSLVDPGEEVILPSPYFSSHGEQVSIAQGVPVPVAMKEDPVYGFRLDLEKIKAAITPKTKAIIVCSPANPTGAVFPKEDLEALADILAGKNIFVLTDEVYDYLVFDGIQFFNIASIEKLWPKVVRCCSLSKKYGMMGWRVGYLHTDKNLMMHILKMHDATIVCAPHISQEAAYAALTGPQEVVGEYVRLLQDNRDLICRRMDLLPDLFEYVKPRGTYYAFPKYKLDLSSIDMAKKILYEAGVVSVPGIGFGPEGEHHLRLSFGGTPEDINKAFDRLDAWWKTL